MKIEKLAIDHRDLLFSKLKDLRLLVSEYSFANLYLFRETHRFEIIFDAEIFIRGQTYRGERFLMPVFDVRRTGPGYLKKMLKEADIFYPIPEEWLSAFPEDDFKSRFDESDSDYIFTVRKMATFEGHKLHNKRNLLKQFVQGYRHEAFPLTNDRIKDAVAVLEEWQAETGADPDSNDYRPCLEALRSYDELAICGGIFYVEGEPAVFILGEEINDETFALHFAKGKKIYKGLYQYMYNTFALILPSKYKYLNFEQDLGNEALRSSKSSYVPDMMVNKFSIILAK